MPFTPATTYRESCQILADVHLVVTPQVLVELQIKPASKCVRTCVHARVIASK